MVKEAVNNITKNMMAVYISKSSYCIGPNGNILNKIMSGLELLREISDCWVIDGDYYNQYNDYTSMFAIPPGEYQWKIINQGYTVSEGKKSSSGGWLSIKVGGYQGLRIVE